MATANPYQPPVTTVPDFGIKRIRVAPFETLSRGLELLKPQYWLFMLMTTVALLVGSLVPFGVLIGPILVGVHLCLARRERGEMLVFGDVFKGFDQFLEALIARIITFVVSIAVTLPVTFLMMASMFGTLLATAPQAGNAPPQPPVAFFAVMIAWMPLMILVSVLVYVPFFFTFQLIADRRVPGIEACKWGAKAAWKNLLPVSVYVVVSSLVSMLAAMACYLPAFLVAPIVLAGAFIMYRDAFGPVVATPPVNAPSTMAP
ncbi:MAG: hypothetical protein AAF958_10825 [Planctomycetota bacterium]